MAILDTVRRLVGRDTGTAADPEQQDFLRQAANFEEDRLDAYKLADAYYDGRHGVKLLDRAKLFLEAHGFEFAENFCETIIDILVEHTTLEGFQVTDNEQASDWLTGELWPRTGMDETQGTVHHNAYLKGDAFLIFDIDAQGVPRACWNDPSAVKAVYDDDNETMLYAVKKWTTSRRSPTNPDGLRLTRMNLYFPDRIEKWFTVGDAGNGSMWAPHLDDDDLEVERDDDGYELLDDQGEQRLVQRWPLWWTDTQTPDGEPLGVNCIHFRNKARGRRYGRSELHSVYSQQNQLNKLCVDLFYVMDAQGWPQRYGTGIPDNASLKVAIGEIIRASSSDASFGQFDPADPGPILTAIDKTLVRMAARARIALHLLMLGGSLPSGETLKTAYTPTVKKTEDREISLGRSWAQYATMALRLHAVFGQPHYSWDPVTQTVDALWQSPEPRNEDAEVANAMVKQDLGVSRATTLRELGYDPEQERELRDAEAKAAAPVPPELAGGPGLGDGS